MAQHTALSALSLLWTSGTSDVCGDLTVRLWLLYRATEKDHPQAGPGASGDSTLHNPDVLQNVGVLFLRAKRIIGCAGFHIESPLPSADSIHLWLLHIELSRTRRRLEHFDGGGIVAEHGVRGNCRHCFLCTPHRFRAAFEEGQVSDNIPARRRGSSDFNPACGPGDELFHAQ
ncbi:hypothetical protein ES703_37398 [subsurface metagenome]